MRRRYGDCGSEARLEPLLVRVRVFVAHARRPSGPLARGVGGVEAQAGDGHEGVAAVRVDRDPAALAPVSPAVEATGRLRVVQEPGAVERVADRTGAVVATGLEARVAATEAVGVALGNAVRRIDGVDDLLRRSLRRDREAVDDLRLRTRGRRRRGVS